MFARTAMPHRWWDEDEATERLLIGYTTGALDEALTLLTEVYTEMNEQARRALNDMQTMCGALLEELAPVAVSSACRDKLLAAMDEEDCTPCRDKQCHEGSLPSALQRYTNGRTCYEELAWRHKRPGVDIARVQGMPAGVLRVQPGLRPVKPCYNTVRFTLVLDGALVKDGQSLTRGSLHVTTPESREPVSTCEEQGCVLLSTHEDFCSLARLLNTLFSRC